MPSKWKIIFDSVTGTSHSQTATPCQDYANGRQVDVCGEPFLVLVCADGAGSASRSSVGSTLACNGLLSAISASFEDGLNASDVTRDHLIHWHQYARNRLSLKACWDGVPLKEYACTLLTGIVGPQQAIFSQIGDGAIVIRENGHYQTVFWPQQGEYSNTTYFLTNKEYENNLEISIVDRRIDEVSFFTDGLQSLALHYASRAVYTPFFTPMFQSLRRSNDPDELAMPLREFLNSTAINSRTDDDKTLMLATRLPPQDD
jgi:hypothetical protein